jgi:uncharacterized protein YdeI (YjbR/CyaY-like superfamily)
MERYLDINAVTAKNPKAWRSWLEKHHAKAEKVWLIIFKKDSGTPSITYKEAVEEALCFGWIDSKPNKRDENSYYQFFAKRKPKSVWSAVNKKKVEELIKDGRMTAAGLAAIEVAKKNGAWSSIDAVEAFEMPEDFTKALAKNKKAKTYFDAFPPSSRKIILGWINSAKQAATRKKRIEESVTLAAQNIRANHYRQPGK